MVRIKRIVLDVLKPHQPNGLDFAASIAESLEGGRVHLSVNAVDEHTETVMIDISCEGLQYDNVVEVISSMGGSVHSIDEVEVESLTSGCD